MAAGLGGADPAERRGAKRNRLAVLISSFQLEIGGFRGWWFESAGAGWRTEMNSLLRWVLCVMLRGTAIGTIQRNRSIPASN